MPADCVAIMTSLLPMGTADASGLHPLILILLLVNAPFAPKPRTSRVPPTPGERIRERRPLTWIQNGSTAHVAVACPAGGGTSEIASLECTDCGNHRAGTRGSL